MMTSSGVPIFSFASGPSKFLGRPVLAWILVTNGIFHRGHLKIIVIIYRILPTFSVEDSDRVMQQKRKPATFYGEGIKNDLVRTVG